ncbi:hypothetical protein ASF43_03115 [Pseudorhodoferax sp. Leaf267]|nr:hypothetical protein ASF43_03115 [Pseudorhodoferax sp. Leaf267]
MAPWSSLEHLHGLVCQRLQEELSRKRSTTPMTLLMAARTFLGQQSALSYRPLTELEVVQLEELRSLYITRTIEAARAPEPSLGVLSETRHLIDMLASQAPAGPILGLEVPFLTD